MSAAKPSNNRNEVQQLPPPADLDLTEFPWVPAPSETVFRAHDSEWGVGYYAFQGRGRFDLTKAHGTMYFGDDLETAVRESLGERAYGKVITRENAEKVRVVETRLPVDGRFAAVSAVEAARFDIIRELVTMSRYEIPQQWAAAFHAAGFVGIRYQSRFTTGEKANAWAVFGPAGPSSDIDELDITEGTDACDTAGIRVAGRIPPMRSLRIIR